jgi:NAD(P)-dependent dehydrogenase (short-subunit alcohol dehydrogenase family)
MVEGVGGTLLMAHSTWQSDHIDPMQVNIKGTFILAQAFLPSRMEGAVVIGTSTAVAALDIGMQAKFSSYAGSKLAFVRLFEIMAVEYPDTHFVTFHPGLSKFMISCQKSFLFRAVCADEHSRNGHVQSL